MQTSSILVDTLPANGRQGSTMYTFDEEEVLHNLKHYLPAQGPLKDFIHHNTLHSFQDLPFKSALLKADKIFGYKISLSLEEFRSRHAAGKIQDAVLDNVIKRKKGEDQLPLWRDRLLCKQYPSSWNARVGQLRAGWKNLYALDMDSHVHPILFRVLCSYLDQGISIWHFPVWHKGFLQSIREMENASMTSFFKTGRARHLLLRKHPIGLIELLKILLGDDQSLYEQYLFDQQFSHPGWSGMVSTVEDQPHTLLDKRKIAVRDLIVFELLLEIDTLDFHFGKEWKPLGQRLESWPVSLWDPVDTSEYDEVRFMWQEAFEWTLYDEVLAGVVKNYGRKQRDAIKEKSFQAMFCIDDRECSLRRYLEQLDPACETFGTPGFFNVEFFFKPEHGKFYTKLCPAPVTPKYLIKELGARGKRKKDVHFTKHSHTLFRGWLISQTLGFWSAFKLFLNIFKPSISPATAMSFHHMDKLSKLTIEHKEGAHNENNLQVGFTVGEMADRVESLLKSIGLVKDFARLVYVVGHGASSVNNPHYAAYDCGACSGRPGSVNARVICFMANHKKVREILTIRGISIPDDTQFVGGLHDTTRDEVTFYDEDSLTEGNSDHHARNHKAFEQALLLNAKERSRRFDSINTASSVEKIHAKIKRRSVSLFEPRPELNHATNALCVVGPRAMTQDLFLDRRSFLNSYDYQVDPDGVFLTNILRAAAPVCGGINLEYFFSRVDNFKLGAGSKLPHNVMGLFGVANGADGDLRPGLPSQMIEVHDPVRLMIIVEHYPEIVLKAIRSTSQTYEWFKNEWVHLAVVHPHTHHIFRFVNESFELYDAFNADVAAIPDVQPLVESHHDNLPVFVIS